MSSDRLLIIGGGIGGLAAGAALAQRGVAVEIVEAKSEFKISGVGLGQPANALRALRALGVLEDVLDAGFAFDSLKVYDAERKPMVNHRFLMGGDVPAMAALPRGDLHRILLEAARAAGVELHMGTQVGGLDDDGESVHVTYETGRSDTFDLVLGFDGVNSQTRRHLFGPGMTPTFSGFGAWRLIVPRPDDVTCMEFYQGVGSKTGVMPLTSETMYLFHVRPEPGNPWHDPERFHDLLRERLDGYGDVSSQVRGMLDADSGIVYSPVDTLVVPPPWHRGRILIAGDAAHAIPPHFTQGAGMALEDAVVLAEELTTGRPLEEQLSTFVSRRFERCNYVSDFATRMLLDEQGIHTADQLEEARRTGFNGMDGRLGDGDRVMDARVLATEEPPSNGHASRRR